MRVRLLELIHLEVPLRKAIRHASHSRTSSANLLVRVELEDGTVGHGEGVPREYVTGETIESAFAMLSAFDVARFVGVPKSLPEFMATLAAAAPASELFGIANDPRMMGGNAAYCALETALIDAYSRHYDATVTTALRSADEFSDQFNAGPADVRYSGAITAETRRKEMISAWKMRIYGFHQVKVKVGVSGQDDAKRLGVMRRILGRGVSIRLDANEAWRASEVRERVRPLLRHGPSALEQPVAHEEVAELASLKPGLGIPIMLDESLCGEDDARRAIAGGWADLFNVRLSKCGGFLASLRTMRLGRRAGLGFQLGCHPGETGVLSAAGRHFASNVLPLHFVEGSYDRYILKQNIIRENVSFGYGGRARRLTGPGLGVSVDPTQLETMAARRVEIHYD